MSPVAGSSATSATSVKAQAAGSHRGLLSELHARHSTWTYLAIAHAVLAAFCLLAGFIDERIFQGVSVWNKPYKFALSIAIYFATLAWFATLLPGGYFRTRRGKLLTGVPIVCALFEMLYILIQAARGEASHFNESTPLYGALYAMMGLGAVLMVSACLWMGSSILRHRGYRDIWPLSVSIGLIGTFVLGGTMGAYLGGAGSHWVGGDPTDAGGLPLVHWSRTGGDLRVAHFFGIHAMQIIPLFGLLIIALQRKFTLNALVARTLLVSASAAFAAFCIATFVEALRGLPLV